MSKKVLDDKNRWRSKTVGFRVSPEEWQEIERLIALSGLTKQDYITQKLKNKEMKIQANPRVVKHLKNELMEIIELIKTNKLDEEIKNRFENLIGILK